MSRDHSRHISFLTRACSALLLAFVPMLFAACPKNQNPPRQPRIGVSTNSDPATRLPPIPTAFNGERAMDHVRKQIDFGPRPPASPPLEKTRRYIVDQLKSYGLTVTLDEFTAKTPHGEKRMANITAELPGETRTSILIASHYDTKFFKDMTFVGANDPAASVGTLLEIGRVIGSLREKPRVTVKLVFFDGEEAFCEGWDECSQPENPDNTYGSRRYVSQLTAKDEVENTYALILLDMMGYKKLELGRDPQSTRWLQDIIWETGRELGYGKVFVDREEGVGGDDHEPFIAAGIHAVDLIQLTSYPHWHRADDTLDKISAQSMKIVGETVLASLPKIAARIEKATDEKSRSNPR
ncbi:MAG TPA: M28 family peptidase [Pyrinomonadaceae bacterium]|nr:M28 family peptidase [Pyrinomonadaceae bacterium]